MQRKEFLRWGAAILKRSSALDLTVRVYLDGSVAQTRSLDLASVYDFANSLRAALLQHLLARFGLSRPAAR